ncbi:MAG TPA: hypothetical protein ENK58_02355 [Desulfobacterales bacterium]|nr:hypothetical protein [Desulfobacterales bacterium]
MQQVILNIDIGERLSGIAQNEGKNIEDVILNEMMNRFKEEEDMSLQSAEIVIPNVRLNMDQLLSVIRQLDEPSRVQVAKVLTETEMNSKMGNLIERLSKKKPVGEISDMDIETEIRRVRHAENRD